MTTETENPKNTGRKRLSLTLLALLTGAALLGPYSLLARPVAQAGPPAETTAAPIEEAAIPVQVATVQTSDLAQVFYCAGALQAKDDVNVAPRVSGRIGSVLVEVGDEVQAGDPIAIIESDLFATQLDQAEANLEIAQLKLAKMEEGSRPEELSAAQSSLEVAQAALNEATNISDDERNTAAADMAKTQAALRRAQSEYDKITWAGQVGETPQAIQLEQATIAYETALSAYNLKTNPTDAQLAPLKAQLVQAQLSLNLARKPFRPVDFDMARAGVKQAEAAVAQARIQMQDTTLKAPFDGLVAKVNVRKGSMVKPETAVIQLVSKDLEVLINIEESRIAQIAEGQNTSLRIVAYPGQEFPAVVSQDPNPRVPLNASGVRVHVDGRIPTLKYTLPPDPHWSLRVVNVADGGFEDLDGGTYTFRGKSSRRLTDKVGDGSPVFSPDGRYLAVAFKHDGSYDIDRLNGDGSGRVRLTQTPLWVTAMPDNPKSWNNVSPAWSPDGSQIAFLTDRYGRWEIWVMNADGFNQRPLFSKAVNEQLSIAYDFADERVLSWR